MMHKRSYSGPERVRRAIEKRRRQEAEEYAEAGWDAAYWMAMGLVAATAVFLHMAGWM